MHTDPGPDNHDGQESSGSWFTVILAIVISVVIVSAIMSTSRRHAVALDEGAPPAATTPTPSAPTQPAPAP